MIIVGGGVLHLRRRARRIFVQVQDVLEVRIPDSRDPIAGDISLERGDAAVAIEHVDLCGRNE